MDGYISGKVAVTGKIKANAPGIYRLEYTVADDAGNVAKAYREVEVVAPLYTAPPAIELMGAMVVSIFTGDEYIEAGYTAVDCLGKDITEAVRVTDNIDAGAPGVYAINYFVEDAGGNAARATRTIIVSKRLAPLPPDNAPTLTIIGSDPIILHLDSDTPYTEQCAYAFDKIDGDIYGNVKIS